MLTIAEAGDLIARRKLSPVELLRSHLQRIERLEGRLHAFVKVDGERALAEAKLAETSIMANGPKGPLHGIPIAHKDIYCTQGIPTTAHSKLLARHVPEKDAVVVARLAAAGTVMLGKLATHEFAWGGPSFDLPWPPARNPWNLGHFTGGSSSGTGAAVAAGLVLGGTGSDTGGSIRLPAAFCGVAGFKPSYGLCPRTGILPLAHSLDHAGPLAWMVEDCAILLQAMAGHDPTDPASANVTIPDYRRGLGQSIAGLRIGFVRHFHERDYAVDEATKIALDGAATVFRELGAELRDIELPPLQDWTACGMIIMLAEAYAVHEGWLKSNPGDYGEYFRDRVLMGAFLTAADYVHAQRKRRELCASLERVFEDVNLLLCAITPGGAPAIGEVTKMSSFERPSFAFPFNVAGAPALSLRAGFNEAGLPLAVQLAGPPFADEMVLRAGHRYECATSWSHKRPQLALSE
jgi:aspartyl-tRNA(Asn)/glutamyl-tRNA(Gln) amidotransferase subunit A